MADETPEVPTLVTGSRIIDYTAYVGELYNDFPHLKPLYDFLNLEVPTACIRDNITIFDVSATGEMNKRQFYTVGSAENGHALVSHLERNPSDGGTRIISVSQLTPTSAKILGSRYDLRADFLNGHLPGVSIRTCVPSQTTFHIDFREAYHLDDPIRTIFNEAKFSEDQRHEFLFFAMVHQSRDFLFIKPDFELLTMKEDAASFLVKQRISIHITQEESMTIGKLNPPQF
jgi:hypothetical protein